MYLLVTSDSLFGSADTEPKAYDCYAVGEDAHDIRPPSDLPVESLLGAAGPDLSASAVHWE